MLKICKKCVAIDSRPGLQLNSNQVCFPCEIANKKIDWALRNQELNQIVKQIKNANSQSQYDCIVSQLAQAYLN